MSVIKKMPEGRMVYMLFTVLSKWPYCATHDQAWQKRLAEVEVSMIKRVLFAPCLAGGGGNGIEFRTRTATSQNCFP